MLVKICGITSLEDARAAIAAGADALGFNFSPESPRRLSIDLGARIIPHLPGKVLKVAVFVNPEGETVSRVIRECGVNWLQFHGDESPEFCRQFGLSTMKAFQIRDRTSLARLPAYETDAWLLDSYVTGKRGGTGETFSWDLAVEAGRLGRPIFLAGGLNPGNVAEAVRRVNPYGVDVSSGVEISPGVKDEEKMRAFVAAARSVGTSS